MCILKLKLISVALITVNNDKLANGDPLNGNRPRTTYTGKGEISDVCIKRKIRNRLQDLGENIFVQSNDRTDDGYKSLSERASGEIKDFADNDEYAKKACEKWF